MTPFSQYSRGLDSPSLSPRRPYLGRLWSHTGPEMASMLVIEVGTHTHLSSSRPAGLEQCGVTEAPGASVTDGAVSSLWPTAWSDVERDARQLSKRCLLICQSHPILWSAQPSTSGRTSS